MAEAQEKINSNTPTPDNKENNGASTEKPTTTKNTGAKERDNSGVARISTNAEQNSNKGGGSSNLLAIVALVIALGALAAGYMAWQKIGSQQNNLTTIIEQNRASISSLQTTAETNKSVAAAVKQTNELIQGRLESIETELNSSVAKLQEGDTTLNSAIANLSEKLSASRSDDWLVAEARHMINIANQQAQLNSNVKAAIAALEAADMRLRDAADPTLIKVRQAVSNDIAALRGISELDISGMALALSTLEQSVESLPLRNKDQDEIAAASDSADNTEVSDAGSFFSKIWDDIKNLVSIRRSSEEQTNVALLPPGQKFFLQQNLRLKLETARLALLQRDTRTFHDSLSTATRWTQRYYDTDATSTANLLTSLSTYQGVELQPELPEISAALRALDEWRSKRAGQEGDAS